MSEHAKYIVIEGADGTGKSTQVDMLQKFLKEEYSIDSIQVHEPDGFEGDDDLDIPAVTGATELRKIIKNGTIDRDPWTNVMLFTASRRLNWLQAMQPALDRGVHVLASRSYLSTVAYQGYGEGVSIDSILRYTKNNVSEEYINPDLEIILTIGNEAIRRSRIDERGDLKHPDTFESKPEVFQSSMQEGYIDFATKRNILMVDASRSLEEIQEDLRAEVLSVLELS